MAGISKEPDSWIGSKFDVTLIHRRLLIQVLSSLSY